MESEDHFIEKPFENLIKLAKEVVPNQLTKQNIKLLRNIHRDWDHLDRGSYFGQFDDKKMTEL